jgi:probable F420-dependent oxidoreductase
LDGADIVSAASSGADPLVMSESGINLGKIGVWTSYRPFGLERAGEAAQLLEQLGYAAWWVGGSPRVQDVRPVLEATATLVAATGILNVWANEPAETAAAVANIGEDFPGRFMLGIGIGHREATSDYRTPLDAMGSFLDGLDASPTPPPRDGRCLAALAPKMLELARDRTAGTHTYFVPVAHTRAARERLGLDKLIATELACVVDTDPVRAKATARDYAKLYLGLRLHRRRRRERRIRPPDRRNHPAGQRRRNRFGRPRAPRCRSGPRLPPATGRGGDSEERLDRARESADQVGHATRSLKIKGGTPGLHAFLHCQ